MEMTFVDANIFLEILLDDEKAQQCVNFLRSAEDEGTMLITTDFVVYTCFIQAERNARGYKSIKEAILFFDKLTNLKVIRPTIDDLNLAAELMDANKLDFDDSLIVACMENNNIRKLASLDRHFDKVKGIERIKL